MRISYDAEVDAIYMQFDNSGTGLYIRTDEVKTGVLFDYDRDGKMIAIEILNASEQLPPAALLDIKAA